MALALSIIDQEIVKKHKIKISFGPRNEKAFESYDNFHSVLKGLSDLSRYFEKTSLVRGFSLVGRKKTKLDQKNYSEKILLRNTIIITLRMRTTPNTRKRKITSI